MEALGRDLADTIVPPPLRGAHRRGLARFGATGEGRLLGQRLELSRCTATGTRSRSS